jgi:hypothetical protein
MPDSAALAIRLKKGIVRIDAEVPGGCDAEALTSLRRSLERTLARLEPGNTLGLAVFRFRLTGGKPLLFQGNEALPLEPYPLSRLLNSMEIELHSDETLDVDGGLAAWLIRPEINVTDTDLRHAEEKLRGMKSGRDGDHAASQTANSLKIRLRSRLSHLVGALQATQQDAAASP